MKLKRNIALTLMTIATVTTIGATTALANNSSDTAWNLAHWSNTISSCSTLTDWRLKQDDTSAYGRVLSGNNQD